MSARIDDHQPPAAAAFSGWLDRVIGSLPAELYPQNRSDERGMREIFTAHAGALCDGDVSAVDLLPVPRDLVEALVAVRPMPATVTHPVGLVRARVGELPVSVNRGTAAWPAWCGSCDGQTRLVEGPDALRRCPDCHPRAVAPRSTMEVAR